MKEFLNSENSLIILYTCKKNYLKKEACKNTWLKKFANKIIVTDESKKTPRQIYINSFGYKNLTSKSIKMWKTIYKKYGKKYKYFIKVDDDTFVIHRHLFSKNTKIKNGEYFGNSTYWSKKNKKKEFWPAGSFYVLSNLALSKLVETNSKEVQKIYKFGPAEDFAIALLLRKKNIKLTNFPGHKIALPFEKIFSIKASIVSISNLSWAKIYSLHLIEKISNEFQNIKKLEKYKKIFLFIKNIKEKMVYQT